MNFLLICLLVLLLSGCTADQIDSGIPKAEVQPDSLEFYVVSTDWEKMLTIKLSNTGTGLLSVQDISIAGAQQGSFSVTSPSSFSLAPGKSDLIQVRCAPVTTGDNNAVLTIHCNVEGHPAVALHGTGRQPGEGDNTVVATLTSAPVVDGDGSDAVWDIAQRTSLQLSQMVPESLIDQFSSDSRRAPFAGEIRAVYTADSVYFRVRYADPGADNTPEWWTMTGENASLPAHWQRETDGHDGLSFIFPLTSAVTGHVQGQTFDVAGCASTCHASSSVQIYEGGHFPATGVVDIWYWQAGLTDPLGYADDQAAYGTDGSVPNLRVPDAEIETMRPNTDGNGLPQYVPGGDNGGYDPMKVLWGPTATTFDPQQANPVTGMFWTKGDRLPGWLLRSPADDRGDIRAAGRYADGVWTIELARALRTGSDRDIQFDIEHPCYFGLAVHDRQRKFTPDEYHALPSLPYPSHYGVAVLKLIFN